MQLRDKGSLITYHVPTEVGSKLVAAGLADEVIVKPTTVQEQLQPDLKFWVQTGHRVEDFTYPPLLRFSCGKCGLKFGHTESWKGTAHETTVVRHCGLVERCPANVAAEYVKAFAIWRSGCSLTAEPSGGFSACSSVADIHAAGLKTGDELKAEYVRDSKFIVRTI